MHALPKATVPWQLRTHVSDHSRYGDPRINTSIQHTVVFSAPPSFYLVCPITEVYSRVKPCTISGWHRWWWDCSVWAVPQLTTSTLSGGKCSSG